MSLIKIEKPTSPMGIQSMGASLQSIAEALVVPHCRTEDVDVCGDALTIIAGE